MIQGKKSKNGLCLPLKPGNVATFQRGTCSMSQRSGQRRDVPESSNNQRRDVGCQRRDVPENGENQHRDVGNQRRDIPE